MDSTVGGTFDGFSDMTIRWWARLSPSRKSERDI